MNNSQNMNIVYFTRTLNNKVPRFLPEGNKSGLSENKNIKNCVATKLNKLIEKKFSNYNLLHNNEKLLFGKLLRTRLAEAILLPETDVSLFERVIDNCVATELVHTASLFHDDIIDNASMRRGMPTLWQSTSHNTAILSGDLLFCEAFSILTKSKLFEDLSSFLEKISTVCKAEVEQEIFHRGTQISESKSITIARNKTGPLFAHVASICAGNDTILFKTLEKVGYLIGTAYQLEDDLIDESGEEDLVGKTLGTDRLRRKFTMANNSKTDINNIRNTIKSLYEKAIHSVKNWPNIQSGIGKYIKEITHLEFNE